ncbi:MAG: addiction module antidote protein [Parvularculaceae bacterium]|nr:putative addiction module antidote protein [Parvularculaceae bacterium]
MTRKTKIWNAAETLETKEDIAAYLDAVLEDGDPDLLKAALGDIARAKGMSEIAAAAGLGRANLYKALSPDGNPEFATVALVLQALGLRLSVVV